MDLDIAKIVKQNSGIIKWAIVGIAVYILYKKVFGDKRNSGLFGLGGKEETSELTTLLESDTSGEIQGAATISSFDANSIASSIKNAWGILNDDEDAVYAAFMRLRSLADLLLVAEKYGYYQPNALSAKEDLATSIRKRMSNKEREKINTILKERGINYAF